MPLCEELTDQAQATTTTSPDVQVNVRDAALAVAVLALGATNIVASAGTFTEVFEDFSLTALHESATATDTLLGTTNSVLEHYEFGDAADTLFVEQTQLVIEQGTAGDTVSAPPQAAGVEELVTATEAFVLQASRTLELTQAGTGVGYAVPFVTSYVQDEVTASVALQLEVLASVALVDEVGGTEAYYGSTAAFNSLSVSGLATDTVATELTATTLYGDVVLALDTFKLPAQDRAWTLSPKNLGVGFYRAFGFESITAGGDTLYTTSEEGVFQHNAVADDGTPIEAYWETGFGDFGVPAEKRVDTVYLTGKLVAMDVRAQVYGSAHNNTSYPVAVSEVGVPRTSRAVLGKGLVGTFWKLRIGNADGEDFVVTAADLLIAKSNRRV